MRLLILDNVDSFTYNLVHLALSVVSNAAYQPVEYRVLRTDHGTIDEIEAWQPDAILISPGPGHPRDATLSLEVIRTYAHRVPMVGVCLGMQTMAYAFGGQIANATPSHGKVDHIALSDHMMWQGIDDPMAVVRYHSLHVSAEAIEKTPFTVTAWLGNMPMAMASNHAQMPMWAVQFHPESIGTRWGIQWMTNFFQQPIFQQQVRSPRLVAHTD